MAYTAWKNSDNAALAAQIRPQGGLVDIKTYSTGNITTTAATDVMPAPGALRRNYVTSGLVTNSSATGTWVNITDTGGNVLCTGYAAPNGGGFLVPGIFTTIEDNLIVRAACETTGANVRVTLIGYVALTIIN